MTYEQIIQKAGKKIVPRVYYYENGTEISLERDDFQQAKFKFNASLVGSVMFGVELEVKTLLPDTEIFIEITARYDSYTQQKVYGGYLRRSEPTYNADAKTYTYEMYDKIITAMVDYKPIGITYPTTVYNFFEQLITELGFTTDINSLPNGSKTIEKDIYDGINYTYRDVLNDIGQATGTLFVIDDNEIKKCELGTSTKTINDDILKNQNITLGKHFGPINTIVLTRSGESDSIYYPEVLPANPIEFRIADNQLMNENDREDYLEEIYNQLNGIEFDIYDTALVGYGGFTPLEKIQISTGGKEYNSYVFNNEITISQGYEEVIYTEMPTETSTDYKASDSTDRRINQVYIIARKNEKEIVAVIDVTNEIQKEINPIKDESGSEIIIEDASNNPLTYLEIEGKSTQETRSGKNILNLPDGSYSNNGITAVINNGVITLNGTATSTSFINIPINLTLNEAFSFSLNNTAMGDSSTGVRLQLTDSDYVYVGLNIANNEKENLNNYGTCETFIIRISPNITITNGIMKPQLEIGPIATEYEAYGVSPSPDFPSEIESVGYENLFDKDNVISGVINADGSISSNNSYSTSDYIKINSVSNYVHTDTGSSRIKFFDGNKNVISTESYTDVSGLSFVSPYANAKYVRFSLKNEYLDTLMFEKSIKQHSYISYGKYGIEVETVGKNSFDGNYVNGIMGNDGTWSLNNSTRTAIIEVKPNTQYVVTKFDNNGIGTRFIVAESSKILSSGESATVLYNKSSTITTTITTSSTTKYLYVYVTNDVNSIPNLMVSKSGGEYQPYQKNTSLIVLNAPLRSLPNGVKDIAYIKNNKLYVDRYVDSVVLDGSETWRVNGSTDTYGVYYAYIGKKPNSTSNYENTMLSDRFTTTMVNNNRISARTTDDRVIIELSLDVCQYDINAFKTWLSTHNTQVDYELATPVTEELGEIKMLKTLKGYNDILTTDKLLPIINLTYVRDTILADYVENHVAELKLTEKEIKTSVETVSSSVDGLNTSINRVEEITNDNSQVINVISTSSSFDLTTGEVREVTTTTGFTFNADGMTIDDDSGFKAEHRAEGTYYKDGTSTIGQYTKDGSKQKDLELFGIYSYGKNDLPDTPMFIAQLFTDENGEECFGHFYNGGDY